MTMSTWKKLIFINSVKVRVQSGEGTAEEIIDSYTKLTEDEKTVLRAEFSK